MDGICTGGACLAFRWTSQDVVGVENTFEALVPSVSRDVFMLMQALSLLMLV